MLLNLLNFAKFTNNFGKFLTKNWDCRAVQRSALCRSRRELSNAYLLVKFGFDTAENEPCQVCPRAQWTKTEARRPEGAGANERLLLHEVPLGLAKASLAIQIWTKRNCTSRTLWFQMTTKIQFYDIKFSGLFSLDWQMTFWRNLTSFKMNYNT